MRAIFLAFAFAHAAAGQEIRRPQVGEHSLRVLTPQTLELEIVTAKRQGEPLPHWNVIGPDGIARLPAPGEFEIRVNSEPAPARVVKLGYKRRPLYATLGKYDMRVATRLYLSLSEALELDDGDRVDVGLPAGLPSPPGIAFSTEFDTRRHSPAIHINQIGYQIGSRKQALAGYYLGDAGELQLDDAKAFHLRDAETGRRVFSGVPTRTREVGLPQYQNVLALDFSKFDRPGRYVLEVDTLGESRPFTISDGLFACVARTYALGLYHQRSGASLDFPYSRFTHRPSHTAPVRIPGPGDEVARRLLAGMADGPHEDQRAPDLDSYSDSLFPIERKGHVAARGGHHDAGDYSKYTTNSALLIHHLMFAHDALPGVAGLDNLGLPESGDGQGDLMQIALHEARFLAKLQDRDGGFFFLVYPEDRKYEDDVRPDETGGQIVFPKNTAATAAAAAALAQIGGSPHLVGLDAAEAKRFVQQAERAWGFLERAWAKHGRDGAYQRISHYGDVFMDRDEIAWAATELFLATKNAKYHDFLLENFRPGSEATQRWGWQRLFEGYGAAARSYGYARLAGRATKRELDPAHLDACQHELRAWGKKLEADAATSAYGISFPPESKQISAAGWHFPISDTLDLVAAGVYSGSHEFDHAILSNIDYELGANPTDTCFLTGLGTRRRFEIVHQWARNDEFHLPMSGIPTGALVSGVPRIAPYQDELEQTIYPPHEGTDAPYAFYDRVIDTFDVATESVSYQLGRGLASAAYLMAGTRLAGQAYTHVNLSITGAPRKAEAGDTIRLGLELDHTALKLEDALIIWEADGIGEPQTGNTLTFSPELPGQGWAVVEAQWPDGRRAFARVEFQIDTSKPAAPTNSAGQNGT